MLTQVKTHPAWIYTKRLGMHACRVFSQSFHTLRYTHTCSAYKLSLSHTYIHAYSAVTHVTSLSGSKSHTVTISQ